MEKSINALLNSNLRVIIPDFGAFIIRQKDPRIVVFNEFLRYNDGLLIGHIAKNEGIEPDIAGQLVSDFTGNITKVLESGKQYAFQGIGSLQIDSSGKIIFESEHSVSKTQAVQEPEQEPAILLSEDEPAAAPKPKTTGKSSSARRKSVPVKSPEPKPEPPVEVNPVTSGPVPAQKEVPVPEETPVKEVQVTVPTPDNPLQKEEIRPPQPVETEIDVMGSISDQKQLIIRWIVLIIVANAAIVAWFVFGDNIKELFSSKKAPAGIMDSVYQRLSDSVRAAATDTTLIFKESQESQETLETLETQETIIPAEMALEQEKLRYYIVAGCFRDEINADELVKSLQDQGFDAEKFGRIGNLFAVSFASFDEKEMAVQELKRIREEIHPEAWMTRF